MWGCKGCPVHARCGPQSPQSDQLHPPSRRAHPRSVCTSCHSNPPWTSCISCLSTSAAPRASLMMMAVGVVPRPCAPAPAASGRGGA